MRPTLTPSRSLDVDAEPTQLDRRRTTPSCRVGREREHERHPVRLPKRLPVPENAVVAGGRLDRETGCLELADELANVLPHPSQCDRVARMELQGGGDAARLSLRACGSSRDGVRAQPVRDGPPELQRASATGSQSSPKGDPPLVQQDHGPRDPGRSASISSSTLIVPSWARRRSVVSLERVHVPVRRTSSRSSPAPADAERGNASAAQRATSTRSTRQRERRRRHEPIVPGTAGSAQSDIGPRTRAA